MGPRQPRAGVDIARRRSASSVADGACRGYADPGQSGRTGAPSGACRDPVNVPVPPARHREAGSAEPFPAPHRPPPTRGATSTGRGPTPRGRRRGQGRRIRGSIRAENCGEIGATVPNPLPGTVTDRPDATGVGPGRVGGRYAPREMAIPPPTDADDGLEPGSCWISPTTPSTPDGSGRPVHTDRGQGRPERGTADRPRQVRPAETPRRGRTPTTAATVRERDADGRRPRIDRRRPTTRPVIQPSPTARGADWRAIRPSRSGASSANSRPGRPEGPVHHLPSGGPRPPTHPRAAGSLALGRRAGASACGFASTPKATAPRASSPRRPRVSHGRQAARRRHRRLRRDRAGMAIHDGTPPSTGRRSLRTGPSSAKSGAADIPGRARGRRRFHSLGRQSAQDPVAVPRNRSGVPLSVTPRRGRWSFEKAHSSTTRRRTRQTPRVRVGRPGSGRRGSETTWLR